VLFRSLNDIAYFQWATGIPTEGVSLRSLDPTHIPGIPEIGLWLPSVGMAVDSPFTIQQAKSILGQFQNPLVLGGAMQAFQTTHATPFGLSINQTIALFTYLKLDVQLKFVDPTMNNWLWLGAHPNEMVFGRYDRFLAIAQGVPFDSPLAWVDGLWSANSPDYVNTNASIPETYLTGKKDVKMAYWQVTYLGESQVQFFDPPQDVGGSDGTWFGQATFEPKDPESSEPITLWSQDIARAVSMLYTKEYELKGIKVFRFTPDMDQETLTESTTYNNPHDYLLNMRGYYGFDIVLSFPHFMAADAAITRDKLQGMSPDEEMHTTFVDVEPITGAGLYGNLALQVNVYNPVGTQSTLNEWSAYLPKDTYYPLYWVKIIKEINDDDAESFKDQVYGARDSGHVAGIVLFIIGAVMVVIGIICFIIAAVKH